MELINRNRLGTLFALSLAFGGVGCSDSSSSDGNGAGGAGGSGGSTSTAGCDVTFSPTDDLATIKTALNDDISSGDTICFETGTYDLTEQLNLPNLPDLTMRGMGASRDDTILDFANQTEGDNGVFMDAGENFTIENLWVKNTPGDGVEIRSNRPTFRNIRVSWDRGPSVENGAYAIYPVSVDDILVEDCEASDASDAAIYVGQGDRAIVRNNEVYDNVLGIEIENTRGAEVYDNHAHDNTTGIALFVLTGLAQKVGTGTLVRDNIVENNNRENFAPPGAIIEILPRGTGIIVLGTDENEIRNNTVRGNSGGAVFIISHELVNAVNPDGYGEPETDGFPEKTYVHDNTFENNGTDPQDAYSIILPAGATTFENVLWDGIENAMGSGAELCLGSAPATFRNLAAMDPTDTTPHECDGVSLPGITR